MAAVAVQVGRSIAAVDAELVELLRERLVLEPFLAAADAPATFTMTRVEAPEAGAIPLLGSPAPWGSVRFAGDRLSVHIPDDGDAAEAALRVLFHVEAAREGGLLLHSSAVIFGEEAVLACGASGAGKSTFARLCLEAGATLLSDEINVVFPSGEVRGTPFRSDVAAPGSPKRAPLSSIFILRKGSEERIGEVKPGDAVRALLSQVYRSPVEPLAAAELLRRASGLLEDAPLRELTFRKAPAAGIFVRDWLRERRGRQIP